MEHLTEGRYTSIYTAMWKGGRYDKWNPEKQILEKLRKHKVVLKRLNNSNNNNVKWFQEVTLSFTYVMKILFIEICIQEIFYIMQKFFERAVSDLGLSGPVNKPLNSIYGNLTYIAPEVLCDQIYAIKSDIYSLGILMWEIVTDETSFHEYEQLSMALAKQCWDSNPDNNRPDANTVRERMKLLIGPLYKEKNSLKSKINDFFKFFNFKLQKKKKK
ncbi:hypothetical protein Glove_82g80 [Diversispora epigaea]|uniref:Protein kinase domain-containing protein n=1 Tax=Diversispora epigaea TaxID=1348612 RepID=A0A397JGW4_9GLOM|nr:hypothetical protein Glove_82g80 [Diversispora epigaea]